MPVVKLSESFIRNNLQCPEGKHRIEMCDALEKGLYIEARHTSHGEGTFYLRYKDSTGKTCHQKIARTTDITLGDARKKAKALKAEIALGANPRGEEKARLAVLTFSEFFEQHYLPYVKPRKRSWKRDDELYRLRIKAVFGHKRLNEITRQQIQLFHTALKNHGYAGATCDLNLKLLSSSLNIAVNWQMLDKNPVARVPLFHEDNKIEHYMNDKELERLLTVLHTDENRPICQIALFLISTGCRLNEVLSAKWSDVDLEKSIFVVRATNAKSRKLRGVPLNESAIEILIDSANK